MNLIDKIKISLFRGNYTCRLTFGRPKLTSRNSRLCGRTVGTSLLALLILAGCTDEKLVEPSQEVENGSVAVEGDAISFAFSVPKDESTRSDQYDASAEDYIDTENKFRVFFFTDKGDFLFGAIDRTITNSTSGGNTSANTYYVRIPMNYLVDREGNEYDVDAIKDYLRNNENGFKIAVLANWPNNGYYSAGDTNENTDENDSNNDSGVSGESGALRSELKGEPKWGWANSVLNPNANPSDIKNINDLHFLEEDTYATAKNDGYSFVRKDKNGQTTTKGGQTVDWVKRRDITDSKGNDVYGKESWRTDKYNPIPVDIDGTDTAEEWIRTNWSPNKTWNDEGIYRQYVYLWKRWDFAGAYACNPVASDENVKPTINGEKHEYLGLSGDYRGYDDNEVYGWGKDWWFRNGQTLKNWMNTRGNLSMSEGDAEATFSFTKSGSNLALNTSLNGGKAGVELPTGGGTFSFLAHSSGRLRITFCSKNSTKASLYANCYNPNNPSGEKTNVTFENSTTDIKNTKTTKDLTYLDVNITGQSRKMEITCTSGTAVIYAIEWIRAKYFYDTDREGVMVSETNPIPMYGVANFNRLTDWKDGTTFELSNGGDDYERKNIKLVRSVAKVLLHIKKNTSGKKVKHVFMRSMNRTARCEPIDVETETANLWKDHSAKLSDGTDGCEWFRIRSHGILWKGSKSSTVDVDAFQKWLSWFYGSWNSTSWKASYNNTKQDEEGNTILNVNANLNAVHSGYGLTPITGANPAYPHLYNPHINRSDYCSFIEIGEDNDYQNFVLYVPDKNIDDTNTVGVPQDVPKVMHIEYRYENQSEHSLDDNDCYRVYFMNYGSLNTEDYGTSQIGNTNYSGSKFDTFEQQTGVLQNLWPVMRNHVYEFYINGDGPATPEVDVKVSDWGYEKVVVDW